MKIFETFGLVHFIMMIQIQAGPLCLNQKQISFEECDNHHQLIKSAHCYCKYQNHHTTKECDNMCMFEKCKADFMQRYF